MELLGGGHSGFEGAAAGDPQQPDHLDLAVTGLGGGGRDPGQGRLGGGLGVNRIGLAPTTPRAAVRPGHLDHRQPVGAHNRARPAPKVPVPSTPTRATGPKRSAQVTRAT